MGLSREAGITIPNTPRQIQGGRTSRSKSYPLEKRSVHFPSISPSNGLHESESVTSDTTAGSNEPCVKRRSLLRKLSSGFALTSILRRRKESGAVLAKQIKQMTDGSFVKNRASSLTGVVKTQTSNDGKKKLLNPVRAKEEIRKGENKERKAPLFNKGKIKDNKSSNPNTIYHNQVLLSGKKKRKSNATKSSRVNTVEAPRSSFHPKSDGVNLKSKEPNLRGTVNINVEEDFSSDTYLDDEYYEEIGKSRSRSKSVGVYLQVPSPSPEDDMKPHEATFRVFHAASKFKSFLKDSRDRHDGLYFRQRSRRRHSSSGHYSQDSRDGPKKETPLARFRRYGNFVRMALFWYRMHNFRYRENEDEISPYIKGLHFHDYDQHELMFDKSRFKAKKSIRIPEDTKRILCKRPSERTPEELYTAAITLRNIKAFAQYPQQMQEKIVACGQYEKFEAKRIILRQGHPGSSYYFMLSGEAVVMIMDLATSYARPINHLEKGNDFGEIALSLNTSRKSTVITKEPCELLSIDKRDYQKIFMHGGRKSINDPDQEQFLRSLPYLDTWPLERLEDAEEKTCFLYYKRGDTIIKESSLSPWLVIVKSGSISVLKKLKRVQPFEWRNKKEVKFVTEKEKRENLTKREIFRRQILAELKIPLREVDSDDIQHEEYPGKPKVFTHPGERTKTDIADDSFDSEEFQLNGSITFSGDSVQNDIGMNRKESFQSIQNKFLPKLAGARLLSDGQNIESNVSSLESRDEMPELVTLPSKRTSKTKTGNRRESLIEREKELIGMEQQTRTVKDDVDANVKDPDEYTLADLKPEFVRVQTLTKGQVFGLSDLILEQKTNFAVISNSADVILIDRNFYMKHAPEKLISKLRQELCPYPSEDEMQQKLQSSVDWDAYRNSTMTTTLNFLESRRKLRESQRSLPVISVS
ncbi:hypothetical protein FSP39_001449 [Pinctada imbricata]|uniref:Cyclic nucleotide-binding domain-containing protein n=1 Tax=Pinctada imbricata TaxID=66713 RepID=A0AA88YPB3_PINIB|nr:hypothetical protein FSP39_001449 [Pinctada imbricata]